MKYFTNEVFAIDDAFVQSLFAAVAGRWLFAAGEDVDVAKAKLSERTPRPGRPRGEGRAAIGIQAVEIACQVLDMIKRADSAVSLTQLADSTGLSPSKLHRYLVSLIRAGFVSQSPVTGHYGLGSAARTLGAVALMRFDGHETVGERVTQLSEALGCSAFVYIWIEIGPVLVKMCSPGYTEFNLRVGSSIPLIGSACGPVFLAHLPPETTRPVFERNINKLNWPQGRNLDARAIERLRNEVRQEAVHWESQSILPGYAACAAPVFDGEGQLFCVIGLAVAGRKPAEEKRMGRALVEAAAAISTELGFRDRAS
jgi:DNA-binding IclR family transcriptional regulator